MRAEGSLGSGRFSYLGLLRLSAVRTAIGFGLTCLHCDPPRAIGLGRLGNADSEQTVFDLRFNLLRVWLEWKLDDAAKAPDLAFGKPIATFFLTLLAPRLAGEDESIVLDGDLDILIGNTGKFGVYLESGVGFANIDTRDEQRFAVVLTSADTPHDIAKQPIHIPL
jgi:hypothetical protein